MYICEDVDNCDWDCDGTDMEMMKKCIKYKKKREVRLCLISQKD